MIFAMGMLYYYGIEKAGGLDRLIDQLRSVSPTYLNAKPTGLAIDNFGGIILFVLGWLFAGFGVIGQPHIMIRFMTIDDSENMKKTQWYYYSFFVLFTFLTYGVGLMSRVLLPVTNNFDAELALPLMSQQLLPKIAIGIVLAGLFSATMSTADSQILSCSAALTRDIFPGKKDSLIYTKLATAFVTIVALFVALFGGKNVFELVVFSWSVLAAAFGPLLFLYTLGKKISEPLGIIIILSGVAATFLWQALDLSGVMYEVAPGICAGLLVYFFSTLKPKN